MLGALALVLFAILFLRLWSLQVLSGDEYLNAAQNNQLRLVRVEAPRGPIVDRQGRTVVSNVAGTAVRLWVGDMPKEGRYDLIRRLAEVVDVPPRALAREVEERRNDPLTPITVKSSVGREVEYYLLEHQAEFPGVQIAHIYLRDYEYNSLAAHILGHVGEISPEELKRLRKEGYRGGDRIGKTGIESAYDAYLRGDPGVTQIRVDSLGNLVSGPEERRLARPGFALQLTVDIRLQRAAERALQHGINLAHQNEHWAANGGAIVAMDPRDGAILAMASSPTYKPSVYVGRADPEKLAPLLEEEAARRANSPGLNRATAGLYPPGSTWKPVTALAAMQEHVVGAYDSLQCSPVRRVRARQPPLPQLEPVHEPPDVPRRGARRVLRHLLLRAREPLLPSRLRGPRAHAAVGEAIRVRRARRTSTSAARRKGSCRRPTGAGRPSTATGTAPGTPATRSSSRSARRTCS